MAENSSTTSNGVEMASTNDVSFTMSNPHASDRALMKKKDSSTTVTATKPVVNKNKLSEEEREEFSSVFELFCGDSSNIARKEIGNVMRKLGQNPSDEELKEMVDEVDIDGYGAINKKNFMMLMTKKVKGSQGGGGNNEVDINEEAFQVFDQSSSGKLLAADIRNIMTNVGEKLCDEEVEEMLAVINADKSGVTYESFLQLIS